MWRGGEAVEKTKEARKEKDKWRREETRGEEEPKNRRTGKGEQRHPPRRVNVQQGPSSRSCACVLLCDPLELLWPVHESQGSGRSVGEAKDGNGRVFTVARSKHKIKEASSSVASCRREGAPPAERSGCTHTWLFLPRSLESFPWPCKRILG